MEGARPLPIDALAGELEPIIADIRTAEGFLSKKKDLTYGSFLFEARAGKGRLLATAFNLKETLGAGRPEALYLCDRIVDYMARSLFQPKRNLSPDKLRAFGRS